VKALFASAVVLVILACSTTSAQNTAKDEGGRVLGLENAWNHAIEAKDTKALLVAGSHRNFPHIAIQGGQMFLFFVLNI